MMNWQDVDVEKYWYNEGLNDYFKDTAEQDRNAFDAVDGKRVTPLPLDKEDLVRLHFLLRSRKSFTVLEFGIGNSTIVIADALMKNSKDWEELSLKAELRNRYMFQCFSVDSSQEWIDKTIARAPQNLKKFFNAHYSEVEMGTYQGQICHYYKELPDIVPDFIYLDGPHPQTVQGQVRGLSFQCNERTVMSADLLLMESVFLPGLFILIDGRTNNARFLKNNFKRQYQHNWDRSGDITSFELVEERLGKYNLIGSDFY